MWIKRFLYSLVLVSLGVLTGISLFSLINAADIYDYHDSVQRGDRLPDVNAVVCLAGARGRIPAAADLWYLYWQRSHAEGGDPTRLPSFMVSGMGPEANWAVLSEQVRPEVLEFLKKENVVLETFSTNTEENARWLAKIASERKWGAVVLVTSSYHMRRASFIFKKVLANPLYSNPIRLETYSIVQEPYSGRNWRTDLGSIRVTLFEYLKWNYYRAFW